MLNNLNIEYLGLKNPKQILNASTYTVTKEDANQLLIVPNQDITITIPALFNGFKVLIINEFEKEITFDSFYPIVPELVVTESSCITFVQFDNFNLMEYTVDLYVLARSFFGTTDNLPEGQVNLYFDPEYYKDSSNLQTLITDLNTKIQIHNDFYQQVNTIKTLLGNSGFFDFSNNSLLSASISLITPVVL